MYFKVIVSRSGRNVHYPEPAKRLYTKNATIS